MIQVEFTLPEIATYIASRVLPDFYENMRLENINLDPNLMNGRGDQPLTLTYTLPGRVEDFEMYPREHAFPLIAKHYPGFAIEKVQFIKLTPLWLWTEKKITIIFEPQKLACEPTGEIVSTHDAYVSLSRAQVFISLDIIQEYLATQLTSLGLIPKKTEPLEWDSERNAFIYHAGTITLTWVLSRLDVFEPILHFLNLDNLLKTFENEYQFCVEEAEPLLKTPIPGIRIPLAKRERPYL